MVRMGERERERERERDPVWRDACVRWATQRPRSHSLTWNRQLLLPTVPDDLSRVLLSPHGLHRVAAHRPKSVCRSPPLPRRVRTASRLRWGNTLACVCSPWQWEETGTRNGSLAKTTHHGYSASPYHDSKQQQHRTLTRRKGASHLSLSTYISTDRGGPAHGLASHQPRFCGWWWLWRGQARLSAFPTATCGSQSVSSLSGPRCRLHGMLLRLLPVSHQR